ncbi:ClC family H(+)/Cl(-) exchange transporter [Fructilactobacillus florum]|uniref:ClC family H(+)/Cl(-) exchange transporter n=1 Tax=Fructilactobacillus florum TaxID=640331 RepID=UPI0009E8D8A9|nr:ClC family H(+)/Cl(-) exchange transporter [Fructilactobacillus florum]
MTTNHFLSILKLNFITISVVIGVITGGVISAFRLLIEAGLKLSMVGYASIKHQPEMILVVILVLLMITVAVGLLLRLEPNIRGSGIPQVEAQVDGVFELNWFSVLWKKFTAGVLTNSTGIFVGREGPSIQLGAAVGQGLAAGLKQTGATRRLSIATGAAAGLSATFSAPLAGTFFVIEGMYRRFEPTICLSALTSALCSNFISERVFGLNPVLPIFYSQIYPPNNYWQLLPLGVLVGGLGFIYNRGLLTVPKWFQKIKFIPWYFYPGIAFLLVIPIGIFFPATIGGGARLILLTATHKLPLSLILFFIVLRFTFGLLSYGSGVPGGFFLPLLTMGALVGVAYGMLLVQLVDLPPEFVTNLLVFGMAGYLTAVCKAPFTAILLITELVGNTHNFMALATVVLVAYLTSDFLGAQPIYHVLAAQLTKGQRYLNSLDQLDQLCFTITQTSPLVNEFVETIAWPPTARLITIERHQQKIIPQADTKLAAGDTLIFLVHHEQNQLLTNQINRLIAD